MDTSKEYIKMCEKAVEIQDMKSRTIETGDFYYQKENRSYAYKGVHISKTGIQRCPAPNPVTWRIWLPRQDQLQGMIDHMSVFDLMRDFNEFNDFNGDNRPYTHSLNSMEHLWLAFVMKEKFNKTWNGTEWEQGDE
jgi:hypothetical protein